VAAKNHSNKPKPDLTDRAFHVSLFLKGFDGTLEVLGGVLLLLVKPDTINRWAKALTEDELSRDPHDFIANHILRSAHELTGASLLFGSLYLLSHGIVKLVLVVEVLRDRLWAYNALIAVTALFIVYQLYRIFFVKPTWGMIYLTVLDVILIYLTRKEYRRHKALRAESHG